MIAKSSKGYCNFLQSVVESCGYTKDDTAENGYDETWFDADEDGGHAAVPLPVPAGGLPVVEPLLQPAPRAQPTTFGSWPLPRSQSRSAYPVAASQ